MGRLSIITVQPAISDESIFHMALSVFHISNDRTCVCKTRTRFGTLPLACQDRLSKMDKRQKWVQQSLPLSGCPGVRRYRPAVRTETGTVVGGRADPRLPRAIIHRHLRSHWLCQGVPLSGLLLIRKVYGLRIASIRSRVRPVRTLHIHQRLRMTNRHRVSRHHRPFGYTRFRIVGRFA